jgi:proteasome lid subunit RPN8/RPN11
VGQAVSPAGLPVSIPAGETACPTRLAGTKAILEGMLAVEEQPWRAMVEHAERLYPEECCGAMLGHAEDGVKRITRAIVLENAAPEPRRTRYEVRPEDLLAATAEARRSGLELLGIYHSHPGHAAYFSEADLKNSCPWYSFLVLSIVDGEFDHAASWIPDAAQRRAEPEELLLPKSLREQGRAGERAAPPPKRL